MDGQTAKPLSCLLCGQECQVILTGLFDGRFGAPGTFAIAKCAHCGLEQTWPRPGEAELKGLYERYYNFGGEQDTGYTKAREWFLSSALYRLWLKWDGDMSFHLRRGTGRLLDLGCNEGRNLTIYAGNGFQAEGLELNEKAAAAARVRGFTVYTMPLTQFAPKESYDVVVLSNVVEHVIEPVAMLDQVRRLLSTGGEVWISCPNADSYWRRVWGRHWINWHVPFHLWHFSPQTLQEVLKRANLRIVEIETCTPALWMAQTLTAVVRYKMGRANNWLRSAPVIASLMGAARGVLFPIEKHLNRQMSGDCLIVTARPLNQG